MSRSPLALLSSDPQRVRSYVPGGRVINAPRTPAALAAWIAPRSEFPPGLSKVVLTSSCFGSSQDVNANSADAVAIGRIARTNQNRSHGGAALERLISNSPERVESKSGARAGQNSLNAADARLPL